MPATRQPVAAGRLYPAEPRMLRRRVDGLLAAQTVPGAAARAVVAPHGSYEVAGATAAAALAWLRPGRASLRRVALLGPSHLVPLHGIALSSAGRFLTPLGEVEVDQEAQRQLRDLPQVTRREDLHRDEHSLEVLLPFLQRLLPDVPIVPMLVGQTESEEVREALEVIGAAEDAAVVVSSDLSHYHTASVASELDHATSHQIESLDALGHQEACGRTAINGLLAFARRHGWEAHTLARACAGDADRVVGYGAYVFLPPAAPGWLPPPARHRSERPPRR